MLIVFAYYLKIASQITSLGTFSQPSEEREEKTKSREQVESAPYDLKVDDPKSSAYNLPTLCPQGHIFRTQKFCLAPCQVIEDADNYFMPEEGKVLRITGHAKDGFWVRALMVLTQVTSAFLPLAIR